MIDQKMTMSFSQALMKRAAEYYIRNVLLKSDVSVEKVEMADAPNTINSVHHFNVHLVVPDE